jgi:Ca2+-binding RTX toxin-like protein
VRIDRVRYWAVLVLALATCLSAMWLVLPDEALASRSCRGVRATKVGSGGKDKMRGTIGRDVILGLGGDDILLGFEGNDVLCGGSGDDLLVGAFGDDILVGGSGSDGLVPHLGRDRVIGGPSRDGALYWWATGVRGDLARGVMKGEGNDRLTGIEDFVGSDRRDKVVGDGGKNLLIGGRGDDRLHGEGGDDILVGSDGSNKLDGGRGRDLASYFFSPLGVNATLKAGRASHGLGVDLLPRIENLEGSKDDPDDLIGNSKPNRFFGWNDPGDRFVMGGGNDVLVDLGDDTMASGGPGNDLIVTPKSATGIEGGGGKDKIKAKVANGGGGNDRMWVNYGYGNGGGDLIVGSGEGGEGADEFAWGRTYYGGPGVDIMHSDPKGTTFAHLPDSEDVPAPEDADIASYGMSKKAVEVDLAAGTGRRLGAVKKDTFAYPGIAVFGSRFDDLMVGHSGADKLLGWLGADTLNGAEGDDFLRGAKGADTADGGLGIDRCPTVENATFCEDFIDELPFPPSLLPEVMTDTVNALRRSLSDAGDPASPIPSSTILDLTRPQVTQGAALSAP